MGEQPHILVVDDHREIRDAVTRYLEKNGMRATSARDAVDMDAKLASGQFDLIVLDVMMPGTDGLELLALLRRAGVSAPVVFLTAKVQPSEVKRYRDAGALDVIPKPYEPEELCEALRDVWAARADQPAALRVSGAAEGLRSRRA